MTPAWAARGLDDRPGEHPSMYLGATPLPRCISARRLRCTSVELTCAFPSVDTIHVSPRRKACEAGSAGELLPQCRVGPEKRLQILRRCAGDGLYGVADDVHLAHRHGGVRGDPALHLPGRSTVPLP